MVWSASEVIGRKIIGKPVEALLNILSERGKTFTPVDELRFSAMTGNSLMTDQKGVSLQKDESIHGCFWGPPLMLATSW
jgi:hypothetical protein